MKRIGARREGTLIGVAKAIALLLALCGVALALGACGDAKAAQSQSSSTSSTIVGAQPKGESAVHAPMRVTYGSGSIGAADPTTTLPNERGQTIQPGLSPGQNIIIKSGRVFPQLLEASQDAPVVWYNLTGAPQRILFDNYKYYPVDSGTIPPGGTFTWTPPNGGPANYTLEPSGFNAKVFVNPSSGGPTGLGGNSGGS